MATATAKTAVVAIAQTPTGYASSRST
jgi:hypothetical protein